MIKKYVSSIRQHSLLVSIVLFTSCTTNVVTSANSNPANDESDFQISDDNVIKCDALVTG